MLSVTPNNLFASGNGISKSFTLLSGESVVAGEVLGKVTASGKLKAWTTGAADGSETAYCVAAQTIDASSADATIECWIYGNVNYNALTVEALSTIGDIFDDLRTVGIYVTESASV